jgi:hypothetical protein
MRELRPREYLNKYSVSELWIYQHELERRPERFGWKSEIGLDIGFGVLESSKSLDLAFLWGIYWL